MDPASRLPESVDITVVGGGIMGTSTAYFLGTRTDLDVLLLEKNNVASGSTGDSSAILRHHYGQREIYSRMAHWSHEFYRNFEAETGQQIAYNASPLVRMGKEGEPSGEMAQAGYEVLSSLDIPTTRLEGAQLQEEFRMLALEDVDFGVRDDTAAYSDGTDAASGFARAAQDAGVTLLTGVAVEDIAVEDGQVAGVQTDHGDVETEDVVVAAGPWTKSLMEPLGVDVPIELSREQILLLEPSEEFVAEDLDGLPTSSTPGAEWYMRSDFGDGVLIATHHTGSSVDPDHYKETPDEETVLELIDELESFVPELGDAKLQGEYCGIYSDTPDLDFILDEVGPEGCYLACGFPGHGFKHGPAIGKMLTDLVIEGDTDLVDVEYFSLDRFEDDPKGHAGDWGDW